MEVKFKMRNDGICLTDCPFNVKCKVMSITCELCLFFRKKISNNEIKCNANNLFKG